MTCRNAKPNSPSLRLWALGWGLQMGSLRQSGMLHRHHDHRSLLYSPSSHRLTYRHHRHKHTRHRRRRRSRPRRGRRRRRHRFRHHQLVLVITTIVICIPVVAPSLIITITIIVVSIVLFIISITWKHEKYIKICKPPRISHHQDDQAETSENKGTS